MSPAARSSAALVYPASGTSLLAFGAVTGDFLDPGGFNGVEVSGALFSLIGVHPVIAEPRQRGLVLTDPQVFKADAVAGEEGSGVDVFGGETRYRDFSRGRCHDVGQWRGEQQRAHG